MSGTARTRQGRSTTQLSAEIESLRQQLAEAEETIGAIRTGSVDAFLMEEGDGSRVYTLETADRPYRVLVETMQQGALVLGPDGTVLYANGRIADILGTPHERLVGGLLGDCVEVGGRPAFDTLLAQGHRDGTASGEVPLKCAEALTPVHLTISRLPNGNSQSLCVIVTDQTREKEHQAIQRDREVLQHSSDVLVDADRRKDEFLATLAHELRMPLAPIRSALEVLRLKGAASPEIEWAQNVIARQVKRMTRLVDDLLDLGRITSDQLTLRRTTLDLSDVLRGAMETTGPLIEEAGHELLVVLPPGPILIDGDPGRLTQVFANLLNNACCFSERYGSIEVRGTEEGDMIAVTITDRGTGIAPELMPHIFEMFRRADRSQGHERAGLGIGLALVKKIVTLHGGTVEMTSAGPGTGATATVRLPRYTAGQPEPPVGDYARGNRSSGKRILVVDDNVDTADAMAAMLRLHGDEVRAAYSGAMALELGRKFEPQVVLLDLAMPVMDGFETCRQLRTEEWGKSAHVIAVTGWGSEENRERSREECFDQHLLKPVDPKVLSELLQGLGPRRSTPWPELRRDAETARPAGSRRSLTT